MKIIVERQELTEKEAVEAFAQLLAESVKKDTQLLPVVKCQGERKSQIQFTPILPQKEKKLNYETL